MADRFIALIAGFFLALAGSQAPRFTEQYVRDLNEWMAVVESGPEYANAYDLADHRTSLMRAQPFARPIVVVRDALKSRVVRAHVGASISDYRWSIPFSLDALAYAGGFFAIGWGALTFLFGLMGGRRI